MGYCAIPYHRRMYLSAKVNRSIADNFQLWLLPYFGDCGAILVRQEFPVPLLTALLLQTSQITRLKNLNVPNITCNLLLTSGRQAQSPGSRSRCPSSQMKFQSIRWKCPYSALAGCPWGA